MRAPSWTLVVLIAVSALTSGQTLQRVGSMAPLSESPLTYPKSISPDGTVIVGTELVGGGESRFSWTAEEGFVDLNIDWINAVESSDPRVYLGTDNGQPFRLVDGVFESPIVNDVVRLDDRLAAVFTTEGVWDTVDGNSFATVKDVSGDGTIFVGNNFAGTHSRAAIWAEDTEFLIPELESIIPQNVNTTHSEALAISADGSTVVGYEIVEYQGDDFNIGWVWTEERGILPVLTLLQELEIAFNPGWTFEIATDVSSDGSHIVGQGFIGGEDPDEIWLLKLTPDKIVVNSTGDSPRQAGGNSCFTGATIPGGAAECTLRSAIEAVNAGLGSEIEFDIPGGGVPVITPGSPLPAISESVELDATTQPGVGRVCIDGQSAGAGADGLRVTGGEAEVRGFEVINFLGVGIRLSGGVSHKVLGNFLGTNAAGLADLGNQVGIAAQNISNALIGGTGDGEANVISGNEDGLVAENCASLKVLHNFIGVKSDGITPLPNQRRGMFGRALIGLELGNSVKPMAIIGKDVSASFEGLRGFSINNILVGLGVDGETTVEDILDGMCLDDCTDGTIDDSTFAGASETSLELLNSHRITMGGLNIGTGASGVGSLAGKVGLKITGGTGLAIGKLGGELSVVVGKLAISMKGLSGALNKLSNVHAGVDHAGGSLLAETEIALLIEDSSAVKIEGKGGGGTDSQANSLFAGSLGGMEIRNSSDIVASRLSVNTSADGATSISLAPIGVLLESVSKIDFGSASSSSLINGITGLKVNNLSGSKNTFTNLTFNLNTDGDAPLSESMDCAISMDNCNDVFFDQVTIGEALVGMEINGSGDIEIVRSSIGQALAHRPGVPLDLGIVATDSENIKVAGGGIYADTGIHFQGVGGESNEVTDLRIGYPGFLDRQMSRAIVANETRNLQIVRNSFGHTVNDSMVLGMVTALRITLNVSMESGSAANRIGENAIKIHGGSTDVEVRANVFNNFEEAAVRVSGAGNQVVVRDNVMIGNGDAIVRDVVDETLRTLDITGLFQGSTHVSGSIQGEPGETLLVDFYAYDSAATTVEARYYLGVATLTLDASGKADFAEVFAPSAPAGWNATATVTNAEFGTSPLHPGMAIAPAPDSDNDGFPDTWEALYPECFTVGEIDAATEDCDGDGLNALEEFLHQTDPGEVNVAPPLSLSRSEAGVIASMQAKPGRHYTLEFSPDLTAGNWATIASENVVKAGTLLLSHDRDGEAGYYRMRLSLP